MISNGLAAIRRQMAAAFDDISESPIIMWKAEIRKPKRLNCSFPRKQTTYSQDFEAEKSLPLNTQQSVTYTVHIHAMKCGLRSTVRTYDIVST